MDERKKYRVLLFDLSTTGHHGYYVAILARHLCANGHEVHFMTLKQNQDLSKSLNLPNFKQVAIDAHYYSTSKGNFFIKNYRMYSFFKKCMAYAKAWQADLFQILYLDHNIIPLYVSTLFNQNHSRVPIAAILFWPFFVDELVSNHLSLRKIYRTLNRLFLKKLLESKVLAALFVHSSNLRQKIIDALHLGQPCQDRIVSIPDPVLMFSEICSGQEARKRLHLPLDATILLFFGVISRDKGFDFLAEAIKRSDKRFTLLVAGRNVDFAPYFIDNFKEQSPNTIDIITRIEHIPDEEVPYYFLSADAVILPYRKAYIGTSGVLQQSSGAGKPVIAADVGEVGDIVRKYNLGVVVAAESASSLNNAIDQFLDMDKKALKNLRQNVMKYARKHHWRKMAKKVEDRYLQVLAEQ